MKCLAIFLFVLLIVLINCDLAVEDSSKDKINADESTNDVSTDNSQTQQVVEKVNIEVYCEAFCPYCRKFYVKNLKPVLENIYDYCNIQIYPYGLAETIEKGVDEYEFNCHHGPAECYGNKLHGCALDVIKNETAALLYNICMMDTSNTDRGSDDNAADKCGASMSIDATKIKECAKGKRGNEILNNHGVKSLIVEVPHVPYILVNGVKSKAKNFTQDICAALSNPPEYCNTNEESV